MPDMLVNLLKLPPVQPLIEELRGQGVIIRRSQPFEMSRVHRFVEQNFAASWADEIAIGHSNKPVSVFIAIREGEIVGFCGYECTRRDYVGPMGVLNSERGRGVGTALLIACMWGLHEMGYVYGIIGGVGPVDFYAKTVGATIIPDSGRGIYTDMLKKPAT